MSIGPTETKEKIGLTLVQRTGVATAKTIKSFFERPLYSIFLASLIGIIIGLLFDATFPWQLYAIVGSLGVFISWVSIGKEEKK